MDTRDTEATGRSLVGRGRRSAGLLAIAVVLLATPGCSLGTEAEDQPTSAQLRIDGSSPHPLTIISSTDFVEQLNLQTGARTVALNRSDTVVVDLPFEETRATGADGRIYFELLNPELDVASIRMRVDLSPGTQFFDRTATMSDGASLIYYFVSNYLSY